MVRKLSFWYDATGTFDPLPKEAQELYRERRERAVRELGLPEEVGEGEGGGSGGRRVAVDVDRLILALRASGMSLREIARVVGLSKTAVHKRLRKLLGSSSGGPTPIY